MTRPPPNAAEPGGLRLQQSRDDAEGVSSQIEHVLPRNPDQSWEGIFDKEQRQKMTHLWANLIPLSSGMNGDLTNAGYAVKRPIYEADAMFKSARQFAKVYSDWTPDELQERSEVLVKWALSRWPG